ncbi:cationic peroxidase 1 [Quercus suber]|uniref:peroxidase n=1 Tax=Quercus suber TaxID=58331 RepID=A0AAW0LJ19_QUESU
MGFESFDVIDTIKSQLENMCPGVVSCADIVTVVAVRKSRRDSTIANLSAANSDLPSPALNLSGLITTSIKSNCPSAGGDGNLAPLDVTSPTSFDNAYFKNLLSKKGLLHSDQQLFNGGSTDFQVGAYSSDLGSFQIDFANAMVMMGNLSPLTGTSGQIRKNCMKVN